MTGRVLVVDDIPQNVKLLEAKLTNEYYDVLTATNGKEAISIATMEQPDIILLDVMMPEMDGFEACKILKSDADTAHIPIVMVTALSEMEDRVRGLESGADDFITKPINDLHLFARVKSLIRIKVMLDELRVRDKTSSELGMLSDISEIDNIAGSQILIINDDIVESRNILEKLNNLSFKPTSVEAEKAMDMVKTTPYDLIIVSTQLYEMDGLRLCSQLRSQEISRNIPQLVLIDDDDKDLLIKALEMGVNDYIITPMDTNELIARVQTQLKRKRYQDALRDNFQQSLSMALVDSLTKLFNRRYLDTHLKNIVTQSIEKHSDLSVLSLDIDHFKQVNDGPGLGHHIGDEVLQQVAERISNNIRNTDMATRPGGEEFVIIMPNTPLNAAADVAERMRMAMDNTPFTISARDGTLHCTVSIGVTDINKQGDSPEQLLQRADKALYEAKHNGRNQVVVHAAS